MACCKENQSEIPGLTTRGINLAKAVIHWGLSGFKCVSEDEYKARIDLCNSCHLLVNETTCAHPKCGCFVTKKASLKTESCPLEKWPSLGTPNVQVARKPPVNVSELPPKLPDLKERPVISKAVKECTHRTLIGHVTPFSRDGTYSITVRVICRGCGVQMEFSGDCGSGKSVTIPIYSPSDDASALKPSD